MKCKYCGCPLNNKDICANCFMKLKIVREIKKLKLR